MVLQTEGFSIDAEDIQEGIEAARWPGRLDLVDGDPPMILDGAHNIAGAESLRKYCEQFLAAKRLVLLFGVMRDKDVAEIAGKLFPLASDIVLTAAESERSAEPDWIAAQLQYQHYRARGTRRRPWLGKNVGLSDGIILAAGSLFLIGDLANLATKRPREMVAQTATLKSAAFVVDLSSHANWHVSRPRRRSRPRL
jgi:dihydrofolate synthase/folylpolyglutamate synthase